MLREEGVGCGDDLWPAPQGADVLVVTGVITLEVAADGGDASGLDPDGQLLGVAPDVAFYFCDPHSPWQRGTNENTNGLLHQYLPRSRVLATVTDRELNQVAAELNERPRETLGWMTAAEKFNELLAMAGCDHARFRQAQTKLQSFIAGLKSFSSPRADDCTERAMFATGRNKPVG